MAQHAFHRTGDVLSNEDVVFICRALKANVLKLLCLRECKVREKDLERILELVSSCQSLHQLTLNIGMVSSMRHVQLLSRCIKKNKSLTGLHIHGSDLGDVGMQALGHALGSHPGIVSLDVGDCKLGDMSVDVLYSLMLPVSNRPGITELTLSDNPRISALGWAQFGMCLANCNSLRWLFLDYNPLGDYGASCVLVALSASQSLELLDLEGCGLTEHTGQALLHLVQNHLGSLTRVKLSNNRVRRSTVEAIKKHIHDNHIDDSESVSTVTVDDLFSLNMSRHSSTFKSSNRRKSSTSSSNSRSSSSSSSSDSSSGKDSSSDDDKSSGTDDDKKKKKKQKKKKKKKGKDKSAEDSGDEEKHKKQKKKSTVKNDKTEEKSKKDKKDAKTDKKKEINENKDKKNDEVKSKEKDDGKDKKKKKDKKTDTTKEKHKNVESKEVRDEDLDTDDEDNRGGKKKMKENGEKKSVEQGVNKLKNKEKDKSKHKDDGKDNLKNKEKDKSEGKDSLKDKDKDKSGKHKDKSKKDKKKEIKESDVTKSHGKKKKKTEDDDSDDDNDDDDDDEAESDESLGDELTEVPIFYK